MTARETMEILARHNVPTPDMWALVRVDGAALVRLLVRLPAEQADAIITELEPEAALAVGFEREEESR